MAMAKRVVRALGAALVAGLSVACAPRPAPGSFVAKAASSVGSPAIPPDLRNAPWRVPIAGAEASPITFERMARWPEPGGQVPHDIEFSPDGKWVTYLQTEKQNDETALFAFDRSSKQIAVLIRADDLAKETASFSREEELRRERQRQRNRGITSYRWAKHAPLLVVPLAGDVFVRRPDGATVRLTATADPEIDPQPCDTGERVAFVRSGELFSVNVATRAETPLTKGAARGVTRGLSDFNGQEEFGEQSGYWWSPRCDRIAFLEVDERSVEEVPVIGYRQGRADVMVQRYPATGGKNPIVRLGIVELATRKLTFVRLPGAATEEHYLGRFAWTSDGRALFFQALSRDQKKLQLMRSDAPFLTARVIANDSASSWIAFSQVRLLERSPRLLWTSERTGYRHLELLDAQNGARIAQVTSGDWDVESMQAVDEEDGRVFFTATKESPLERQLYSASWLAPKEPRRLSPEIGVHDTHVERNGKSWVDVHSAIDRPPRAIVYDERATPAGELPCPLDSDLGQLHLRSPTLVKIPGSSGDTLYGALLAPRELAPGKRHPVVVMVYGGPGAQTVQNRWSARLLWQHLSDRGVVVFQLDNRGTPGRGRAFEQAIAGKLGELELVDQLAGVDYLASLPYVDGERVGIYGHSYGGFMAGLALLRAPSRFRVGVAGSPVVDWRLYDTGYTERYLGRPGDNPRGYDAADLGKLSSGLQGKLLILHALMDENVHFQNTARLIDGLTAAGKSFDLLVFPGERHGYRSPVARQYASMRVVDYFAQHL